MNDATIKTLQADYAELEERIEKMSAIIVRTEERLVDQRKEVTRFRGDVGAIRRLLKQNDALPEVEK